MSLITAGESLRAAGRNALHPAGGPGPSLTSPTHRHPERDPSDTALELTNSQSGGDRAAPESAEASRRLSGRSKGRPIRCGGRVWGRWQPRSGPDTTLGNRWWILARWVKCVCHPDARIPGTFCSMDEPGRDLWASLAWRGELGCKSPAPAVIARWDLGQNQGMVHAEELDARVRAQVDAVVENAVLHDDAPGVVTAVARADAIHVATAGVMSIGGPPMNRDTLFRVTSMTKPLTAATVLSLVDTGMVDLDDPVDSLLPELANRRVLRSPDASLTDTVPVHRPITTRDLLTFTWGFGMQGAMFTAVEPWPILVATQERQLSTFGPPQPAVTPDSDTWMARLGELPLLAQPGERWLYQSGSQVLGVLVSRATGAPFDEVLRERILDPLGMSSTTFYTSDTTRLATAYERRDGNLEVSDPPEGQWSRPPAFADGGAGLLSTVDDFVAFGRMLLSGGGNVLKPETVEAMTRNQLTDRQRSNVWPGFSFLDDRGWGFGVSVCDDGRYTWDGGFGTAWSNVPGLGLTVVVLTQRANDETGPPAVCDEVLAAAVDHG